MLTILSIAVLSHLAPLTPDAFYVAAPDVVLIDPAAASPDPCIPKDPDKDYRRFISPAWDPACYAIYLGTFSLSRATYWDVIGQCAPLDCACYIGAWKEFLRIMEQAENDLRHCSPT